MPATYGVNETRAQKQLVAIFTGSFAGTRDNILVDNFKESFRLRTHMAQIEPNVEYVVQNFPVLQNVDFVS